MKYKNYRAEVSYDPDINLFCGKVCNAKAIGTFYSSVSEELESEFKKTVDYYLNLCRRKGIEPEKPFIPRRIPSYIPAQRLVA